MLLGTDPAVLFYLREMIVIQAMPDSMTTHVV